MPDILLTTLNARYIHTAFGLRCLMANLGPLRARAGLREFDIHQRPADIAECLLAEDPKVIGIGVYIWNAAPVAQLIRLLKRIRPGVVIVVGGPEVSYEWPDQPAVRAADYLITGEADLAFRDLCARILDGIPPTAKIIHAPLPAFDRLLPPYELYTDTDVATRILYVEASRGCPFHCEFCLSSLDIPVRAADTEEFLSAMAALIRRGARHLKFVDRTFNLNLNVSRRILEFCLEQWKPDMLFHFEMIPDRLPDALRVIIEKFPPGALQLEVGIQTFNEEVAARISRRQDNKRAAENLRWLRRQTGVHVHADLIAGLPGETLESFAAGFDRLVELGPQEIQVGILKRLRGTPIVRHDRDWAMVYSPDPPYEVLETRHLDFATVQSLKRFARIWDITANSGNFVRTTRRLLSTEDSAFKAFHQWSLWLHARIRRTDAISLTRLVELLYEYLVGTRELDATETAQCLLGDYQRAGRSDIPKVLRSPMGLPLGRGRRGADRLRKRQERHMDLPGEPERPACI